MLVLKKLAFKVNMGAAPRLIAAIALATIGYANYVHADDCNKTWDNNYFSDSGCKEVYNHPLAHSAIISYTPASYKSCRDSNWIYTNQRCTQHMFWFYRTASFRGDSICQSDELWSSSSSFQQGVHTFDDC